eukprot:gene5518-7190_t
MRAALLAALLALCAGDTYAGGAGSGGGRPGAGRPVMLWPWQSAANLLRVAQMLRRGVLLSTASVLIGLPPGGPGTRGIDGPSAPPAEYQAFRRWVRGEMGMPDTMQLADLVQG